LELDDTQVTQAGPEVLKGLSHLQVNLGLRRRIPQGMSTAEKEHLINIMFGGAIITGAIIAMSIIALTLAGRIVRRFWLPLTLVMLHTVMFAAVAAEVAKRPDNWGRLQWLGLAVIDFPISMIPLALEERFELAAQVFPLLMLILGTIQWTVVGLILHYLARMIRYSYQYVVKGRHDSVQPPKNQPLEIWSHRLVQKVAIWSDHFLQQVMKWLRP
jgi:hypothetical protein